MSTIYDKTDNYSLNLYGDDDPADLRDGYNNSMRTIDSTLETHLNRIEGIDSTLETHLNRIEGVESRETHDEEVVNALLGDNTVDNATTAKNKWDKAASLAATNKDDIAAIDTNLNALHASTVTDASNLYNMIITSGGRGGHMVIIGDSITAGLGLSDPSTQAYPRFLAEALGLTAHVYAQSGAGFAARAAVQPYNTLGDLCSQAASDGSYDHDMVQIVLIMGGINDGYDEAVQARTNAIAALNILHNAFTKAQVYFGVCPTCGLSRQVNKSVYSGIPAIASNVMELKTVNKSMNWVCHIIDAWALLWPDQSLTDDGLHPNEVGHKYLAGAILSAMSGQSDTLSPYTTSLWGKGGVRNIMSADQIPDVERYAWIKTHFVSSRQTYPNLISVDGKSWTYKSSFSMQLTYNADGTQPNLFYFPISVLPDCLHYYKREEDWNTLNYDPVFQFYSFSQNISTRDGEGQFLFIVQYNMRYNTIEVAMSGSTKPSAETMQVTLATPTFSIPIPLMTV